MSAELPESIMRFGIPIEEYPLPCRACKKLASKALSCSGVDFNNKTSWPNPSTLNDDMARVAWPYLDRCTKMTCGLDGNAVVTPIDNL